MIIMPWFFCVVVDWVMSEEEAFKTDPCTLSSPVLLLHCRSGMVIGLEVEYFSLLSDLGWDQLSSFSHSCGL